VTITWAGAARRRAVLGLWVAGSVLVLVAAGCKRSATDAAQGNRESDASSEAAALSSAAAPDAASSSTESANSAADASDGAATVLSDKDPCVARCRKMSTELHCGTLEGCRDSCAKLKGAVHCPGEARAFLACLMRARRKLWTCDDEGNPALVDAACLPERTGMTNCLSRNGGLL
jgi:hypothetical protein